MIRSKKEEFFNPESQKLFAQGNSILKNLSLKADLEDGSGTFSALQAEELQDNIMLSLDAIRLPAVGTKRLTGELKSELKNSYFELGNYVVLEGKLHLFVKVEQNFPLKKYNSATTFLSFKCHNSYFGSNIRLVLAGQIDACMSFTSKDEEALSILAQGKFYLHVCKYSEYASTFYDFTDKQILVKWQHEIDKCFAHSPLIKHPAENFLFARNHPYMSPDELLKVAWVDFLKGGLFELFNTDFEDLRYPKKLREQDASQLLEITEKARQEIVKLGDISLNEFLLPLITKGEQKVFIKNFIKLVEQNEISKLIEKLSLLNRLPRTVSSMFIKEVYKCINAIISLEKSIQGSKFIFFNLPNGVNEFDLSLIPYEKGSTFLLEEFWKSFGFVPPLDLNFWHEYGQLPISQYQTSQRDLVSNAEADYLSRDLFPSKSCLSNILLDSDLAETEKVIQELMDEAVANKEWTIPNDAYCDVKVGEFEGITLTEQRDRVYFKLHYGKILYLQGYLEPVNRTWWINPHTFNFAEGIDGESVARAILLVVMALVRDFWVVEERESKFQQANVSRLATKSQKIEKIIYLPRIKYVSDVSPKLVQEAIDLAARSKHTVRAHLRKSQYSSETQENLAKHYNFEIPKGFTFVRPHERGNSETKKIYRSRSASEALTKKVREIQNGPVRWFQFERDVATYMKNEGYDVVHRTASKGPEGDGGIDVLAYKAVGNIVENWLIQCKAHKKPSGPSVIRDLIGANIVFGGDNNLMVVSLSGFTSGAVEVAEKHAVKLIDGNIFAKHI
tara:strand:+ start:1490 stop:3853 length:2364 start_codon:yes stop_codon:yes gene_type:complete